MSGGSLMESRYKEQEAEDNKIEGYGTIDNTDHHSQANDSSCKYCCFYFY